MSFAVFAQVYGAGHLISINGSSELIREPLALNSL